LFTTVGMSVRIIVIERLATTTTLDDKPLFLSLKMQRLTQKSIFVRKLKSA
jgi:hypothetical protein